MALLEGTCPGVRMALWAILDIPARILYLGNVEWPVLPGKDHPETATFRVTFRPVLTESESSAA